MKFSLQLCYFVDRTEYLMVHSNPISLLDKNYISPENSCCWLAFKAQESQLPLNMSLLGEDTTEKKSANSYRIH